MTKDNNFRLEFPTDTEVMGADMSEPPKPPTVASQESDVNGVSDFGLRVKMCVWLGVSRGLDLAFLNAD